MKINSSQYNYTYDKLYQVTAADYPGGTASYGYDKLGVRTSMTRGSTTFPYTTNNLNQLLYPDDDHGWWYDDNGNLLSIDWATIGYYYDCENHLTRAASLDYDNYYTYDYLGRRASSEVWPDIDDYSYTRHVYDGDRVIAEYDGDGNLLRTYVYGAGINEPVMMTSDVNSLWGMGTGSFYYHYDALGSVIALSDTSGNVVETYSYDAYGTPTIKDAQGHYCLYYVDSYGRTVYNSHYGNKFMFAGGLYDVCPGFYHYGARDYAPQLGIFLQPDPVMPYMQMAAAGRFTEGKIPGKHLSAKALVNYLRNDPMGRFLAKDPAGRFLLAQTLGVPAELNLYTYCENNPINLTDPTGYFVETIGEAVDDILFDGVFDNIFCPPLGYDDVIYHPSPYDAYRFNPYTYDPFLDPDFWGPRLPGWTPQPPLPPDVPQWNTPPDHPVGCPVDEPLP